MSSPAMVDEGSTYSCGNVGILAVRLFSLSVIMILPPGISRKIRRNNELSFSIVHSNPGIARRLHTSGSYEGRRKALPQFPLGICRLLHVLAAADFRDGLRPPLPKFPFFFMVVPPSKFLTGYSSRFLF